jgi:hypothetical protein
MSGITYEHEAHQNPGGAVECACGRVFLDWDSWDAHWAAEGKQ